MLPKDYQENTESRPEMPPQKRMFLTPAQWIGMVIGWFVITLTAFALSEVYQDTWVIYPSVFILILFCLVGPGTLGLMVPPEIVPLDSRLRPVLPYIAYAVCLLSVREFSRLGSWLHWF